MKLFDSVMKESQRFNPNLMITPRTILKPVTFSDGTTIPAGVNVCLAGYAALRDPGNYKDAAKFDPYRFLKLRSGEVEDPLQYPTKEVSAVTAPLPPPLFSPAKSPAYGTITHKISNL